MSEQRAQRRSAREIDARRRARERTARVRAAEQKLEDLATEFFLAAGEADDVQERAETRLREHAERVAAETRATTEPLRARQAAAVGEMLKLTRIGAVCERLGQPRDVIAQFRDAGLRGERQASAPGSGQAAAAPDADS
ncbi:hypothetical protein SAMN05216251_12724 [Actinacidiphila alni]|uniref:Uncharacterized protein n=1 Tax=Actinacidiphila alni TaxID=380248 RepID=A0A1I2LC37_9ACTN|nr:hypothetical protein [Actinacidiphila alni]SFF74751.1 hypothetical protein SAMN05216251_12724 [Actinacidiphila alni]